MLRGIITAVIKTEAEGTAERRVSLGRNRWLILNSALSKWSTQNSARCLTPAVRRGGGGTIKNEI